MKILYCLATVRFLSSGQQKDLEGKSHSTVCIRSFIPPSQHLLPDCKNKIWLLRQIRRPLWLSPTLTLDAYKTNKNTTFTKNYQNYLADLAPAYKTMENNGVSFEMVISASLFLPFIHLHMWKWNWTRCSWCKKRRWPCW